LALLAGVLYISPLVLAIKRAAALPHPQEELEAERQRLYAVLDGMPEGIYKWITEISGRTLQLGK
jgi:hypothetical protein